MNTFLGGINAQSEEVIIVALGANLVTPRYATPTQLLAAALEVFPQHGVVPTRRSRWYRSAPVPVSEQPWFTNAVAMVTTALSPPDLLAALHRIEDAFGRRRHERWEARPIDLDLIAYGTHVVDPTTSAVGLELPHPRMHERAFVLLPLREVAPDWTHPKMGIGIDQLCTELPTDQVAVPFDDESQLTA